MIVKPVYAECRRCWVTAAVGFAFLSLAPLQSARAQDAAGPSPATPAPAGKEKIGVGAVKVTPALEKAVAGEGKTTELHRVTEAMDSQLIDRINNTRKYLVVARSDLPEILKEQGLVASGNVDTDDAAAAQACKLAGIKYLILTSVDSFQDYQATANFEAMGETGSKRVIQFSAVMKITDTTTAAIRETANFQLDNNQLTRNPDYLKAKGRLDDQLLSLMARTMADRVANRVIDVLYPARVAKKTGRMLTINRGDGTNIAVGEIWDVFTQGEDVKDPDTGLSLGREETKVGSVRITSVQPLFSKAEAQTDLPDVGPDNKKIDYVLRRQEQGAPAPAPPGPGH